MNKTTASFLLAALVGVGTATALAAEDWHGHGDGAGAGSHCKDRHMGMDMGDRVAYSMEGLELTPDQQVQIRAIVDQSRPAMSDLRSKMGESRKQLHALMQSDVPDEAAIRTAADEQGKLKAEMIVQRSRMQAEINKVLTAEQREKWKAMRPEGGMGHDHDYGHMEGTRT